MINSGLPKNTPIKFEIWGSGDIEIRTGENAIIGIVDDNGNIKVDWLASKEELSKVHYEVQYENQVIFRLLVNDIITSEVISFNLIIKTGECSGISYCRNYPKSYCESIENYGYNDGVLCTWNEETNSCEGEKGISCEEDAQSKEACKFAGCTWKADNLFERFIDWVSKLFGGN